MIARNLDPGPCPGACHYGTCTKTWSDPYGCGGCCSCLGGCQATYEDKQVRRHYRVSARSLVLLIQRKQKGRS